MPDTENLAQIAVRAGYTLEGLISYLDGKPISEPAEIDRILHLIKLLPLPQVAVIGRAVADRFVSELDDKETLHVRTQ